MTHSIVRTGSNVVRWSFAAALALSPALSFAHPIPSGARTHTTVVREHSSQLHSTHVTIIRKG